MVWPFTRRVGWVERSDTISLRRRIDGFRFAPPILRNRCARSRDSARPAPSLHCGHRRFLDERKAACLGRSVALLDCAERPKLEAIERRALRPAATRCDTTSCTSGSNTTGRSSRSGSDDSGQRTALERPCTDIPEHAFSVEHRSSSACADRRAGQCIVERRAMDARRGVHVGKFELPNTQSRTRHRVA